MLLPETGSATKDGYQESLLHAQGVRGWNRKEMSH